MFDDRWLMWEIGDWVLSDEGRSLFDVEEIGNRVLGVEGRSLFDLGE